MLADILVYQFHRFFVVPLALALLQLFRPILPQKIRQMIEDREQRTYLPLQAPPIWIHAASGEIEYAKSVIRSLKEKYPEIPILVTYFSPSAKRLIQSFPGIDVALPLPWDREKDLDQLIAHYRPRMVLFARTDVWPCFATLLHRKNIPTLLFAATIAPNSSRLKWGPHFLFRWCMNQLTQIHCVSESDAETLQGLGVHAPVYVFGDTRFDQALFRVRNALPPDGIKRASSSFVLIAGSTWPEDELILISAFKNLKDPTLDFILAPHELSIPRLENLQAQLRAIGLTTQLLSDLAHQTRAATVLIVDRVGVLAELYGLADLAFVGGSFRSKVHSVMEPLAAGLPVIVGPFHINNREALEFQKIKLDSSQSPALVSVAHSAHELSALVQAWKRSPANKATVKPLVSKFSGATEHVVNWAERALS